MKADEEGDDKDTNDERDPSVRVVDRRWWARGDVADADTSGARKPTYVEELEQRLADTTSQLQRVMTEHRRSLEEFEQVKGRLRRDVGRDVERGKRALLAELLDVLDNLDRAITAQSRVNAQPPSFVDSRTSPQSAGQTLPGSGEFESFVRGVQLVRDQFLGKLEALGVTRMPALGLPFDAQKHEAVTTAPVDDPTQEGVVVAIVREGYAIGDDVLRPASVVVGTHR